MLGDFLRTLGSLIKLKYNYSKLYRNTRTNKISDIVSFHFKNVTMPITTSQSYFWETLFKKIDELCVQHNLMKIKECYEIYNAGNDKYEMTICHHWHPQYQENLIETTITNKKNNEVIYTNEYVFITHWDETIVTLPKPTDEFIDEMCNNLREKLVK